MTTEKTTLTKQADELAAMWALIATNEGSFGGLEVVREIGTADPVFCDVRIYERVGDGKQRINGCDPERAPGRMRRFTGELSKRQAELRDLRKQIATIQ